MGNPIGRDGHNFKQAWQYYNIYLSKNNIYLQLLINRLIFNT